MNLEPLSDSEVKRMQADDPCGLLRFETTEDGSNPLSSQKHQVVAVQWTLGNIAEYIGKLRDELDAAVERIADLEEHVKNCERKREDTPEAGDNDDNACAE